jgi:hypothetical protein
MLFGGLPMYSAVCRLSRAEALYVEAPSLGAALVVAETCYKFHSFLLEGAAFLVTWLAFGAILTALQAAMSGRPGAD